MVERVARAIEVASELSAAKTEPWGTVVARAAIAAMRPVTAEMRNAAEDVWQGLSRKQPDVDDFDKVWQAMIDKALEE